MRKLKITVALLVMLLVCHAVFAAFVPVEKADKALVSLLGTYCDALQNLAERSDKPVEALMQLANLSDESVAEVLELYAADGSHESVTGISQLAVIFPRGVEEAKNADEFRRVAIHLAAYTAKNGLLFDKTPINQAEAAYSIVGYDFLFRYDGEKFVFKFVDVLGVDDFKAVVTYLAGVIPGATAWEYPRPGEIDIVAPGLSQFGFDSAVRFIEAKIYSTIY